MFSLEYTIFAVWAFSWCPDPETYIEKQVFFATEVLALDKAKKPSNPDENQQEKPNKKVLNPIAITHLVRLHPKLQRVTRSRGWNITVTS